MFIPHHYKHGNGCRVNARSGLFVFFRAEMLLQEGCLPHVPLPERLQGFSRLKEEERPKQLIG